MAQYQRENRLWWGADGMNEVPALKNFISEVQQGMMPMSLLSYEVAGHTDEATKELRELVPELSITPKPTRLIRALLSIGCVGDELVMDFFSGSGTLGHAVLDTNMEEDKSLRFVCVQLPEPLDPESEAGKAGYRTIADAARTRIAKAIERSQTNADLAAPAPANLGFKSFLLAPSNFKQWRGDAIDTPEQLAEQIQLFAKSEKAGAQVEDILYELLLKFGQELTTPVETLEVEGSRVFAINDRQKLFVLEPFAEAMIQPLVDLKPREIIATDGVFHDSDQLKSNLELQCRDAGIKFTCL